LENADFGIIKTILVQTFRHPQLAQIGITVAELIHDEADELEAVRETFRRVSQELQNHRTAMVFART
jgi:hypothetical protein